MEMGEVIDDDFVFYSLLYSSITIVFAMAVLSKFLKNEFRFGFRSLLSLVILFTGEPICHILLKGATGVILFGFGCLFVYTILPASHLPAAGKSVLITGCDSGFGQAIAKKLDAGGMQVFAGCLYKDGPGAIELHNSCSERLKLLQLDVTDEKQVAAAHEEICRQVSDEGLWGVVNNAGVCSMSEIEMTNESVFRRMLEVNVLGLIRVTKAFLPLVRKARGRIVNMSSVTGRVPLEAFGAYAISKSSIETYSDILCAEMKKWKVKVSIVEPCGFNTGAIRSILQSESEVWQNLDDTARAAYGERYLAATYSNYERITAQLPSDLSPVVRAVRSALLSTRPCRRYPVGRGAGTLMTILPVLPVWLADRLLHAMSVAPKDLLPTALEHQQLA